VSWGENSKSVFSSLIVITSKLCSKKHKH
jgi:hypothetical protein